jgi:hypothetical protein
MALGRASLNTVYEKMGKPKYSSTKKVAVKKPKKAKKYA